MAKGVPLTVEQAATVKRVWLATANASEAAREAGCSPQSASRYIVKTGLDSAGKLYADALAREEREHLAVVSKARRKVSQALDSATGEDVTDLARAANDSLRAVTATRIAHLRVTGLAAPDRSDVTSGGEKIATVVMLPPLDVSPAATQDPLATEPGPSD